MIHQEQIRKVVKTIVEGYKPRKMGCSSNTKNTLVLFITQIVSMGLGFFNREEAAQDSAEGRGLQDIDQWMHLKKDSV